MQEAVLQVVEGVMGCQKEVVEEQLREGGKVVRGGGEKEEMGVGDVMGSGKEVEVFVGAVAEVGENDKVMEGGKDKVIGFEEMDKHIFNILFYVKALCKEDHLDAKVHSAFFNVYTFIIILKFFNLKVL